MRTFFSRSDPRPEPPRTLSSIYDPKGPRLKLLLFLCTLAVSFVFHWNAYTTQIGADTFTVDSYFYVELARELQKLGDGEPRYLDPLRTPGYPLLCLLAAKTLRIDLKQIEMSPTDWTKLNNVGLRLVERVLVWQQCLAFLLPALIFLCFLFLADNAYAAFVCGLSYYADLPTISYQHTLLSEFSSIFFLWLGLALLALALRRAHEARKKFAWILAAAGLALAVAAIIRPPLALMPAALAPFVALGLSRRPWRARLAKAGHFVAAGASLPLAWCLVQLLFGFGHFTFTTNGVFTLQLFAAPRLLNADLGTDRELATLQKHLRAYAQARGTNGFAMTEVQGAVMRELGWTDYYYYYLLQKRAAALTIKAHFREFMILAVEKFDFFWREPFYYVISPYVLDRTLKMLFFPKVFPLDKRLICKGWTLPAFILACLTAAWLTRRSWERQMLLGLLATVLLFTSITSTIGMDEPDRHAMQARSIINALVVYGAWTVLAALAGRLRLTPWQVAALRRWGAPLPTAGCLLVFGVWLPLNYDFHRNLHDLARIRDGLEQYRAAHGQYPRALEWSGLYGSLDGAGGGLQTERTEWIPGLVPTYISALPRDPRRNDIPQEQYLYRSDGAQYKLISHGIADCYMMHRRQPARLDPARLCYAYGWWTEGASSW